MLEISRLHGYGLKKRFWKKEKNEMIKGEEIDDGGGGRELPFPFSKL